MRDRRGLDARLGLSEVKTGTISERLHPAKESSSKQGRTFISLEDGRDTLRSILRPVSVKTVNVSANGRAQMSARGRVGVGIARSAVEAGGCPNDAGTLAAREKPLA
jgi:hypothetical protein